MVQISGFRPGLIHGTITATGTLSSELDFSDWSPGGLIPDSNVTGTLSFMVSAYGDNDYDTLGNPLANYVDLRNGNNSTLTFDAPGSGYAVSGDEIVQALAPYRYVRIKMSTAQSVGARFYIPV